eukprot:jgi/Psemu1/282410/fgenesh1_pg.7_\
MGWIPLHYSRRSGRDKKINWINGNRRDVLVLGRSDFLSSMFSACGCSINIKSSRNKCKECRSVLAWAGNLSRKTLRVVNANSAENRKAGTNVSFWGRLVAVPVINNDCEQTEEDAKDRRHCRCPRPYCYCNSGNDDASLVLRLDSTREGTERGDEPVRHPRTWSKRKRVHRGTTLSLRYGDDNLDFMVVSYRGIRSGTLQGTSRDVTNLDKNTRGDDLSTNSNKVSSYSSRSRIASVLKDLADNHNRSNRRNVHQSDDKEYSCLSQTSQTPKEGLSSKRVWFCPRGQDMPRKRIDILTNRLLSSINGDNDNVKPSSVHAIHVQVVARCFDATHWIVSERVVDLASIARAIPGSDATAESLQNFLDENDVECLKPSWFDSLASSAPWSKSSKLDILSRPSAKDRWYGYISKVKKRRRNSYNEPFSKRQSVHQPLRNLGISQFFLKLSKTYEQTPYLPGDKLKARQYHLIAGRLQKIGFDIPPHITNRELKKIPFVGVSTAHMIQEILQTNRLRRLEHLQTDPIRIAMRDLMAIWGIGRATALSLIHQGYLNIHQIREGISTGRISCFDRRQLIGVKCYEDLLEDMSRSEVESIFEQILQEARRILPDCEAQIMGSYRRGKTALGDLDVLIVSEQYENQVPRRFLSELVNILWTKGHIAFHLNNLSGLRDGSDTNSQDFFPSQNSRDGLPQSSKTLSNNISKDAELAGSATYMGVFFSSTVPRKHRRVDIKIWPYAQKPYASLYFTGGKYFNRSMRQWAKSKFNWKLDDKGIFDRTTGERVIIEGCAEEDVFSKLQLVYKAPPDRKFFDDVHPILQV